MAGSYEVLQYPEKTWSISKMKVFENCLREYYYTYYGSHNGWLFDSDYDRKMAWRLKKLTNIWLLFGDKLHVTIKKMIEENTDEKLCDNVKRYIRAKLNSVVKESIQKYKDNSWNEYPKGEMLQEYYYGEKLSEKSINDINERIEQCVTNFFYSKTYEDLKNESVKILEVDEGKFDYITINGLKVYALIDALYIDKDGNYIIVDWKTGKIGEYDKEQLLVYALYVNEKYNVPLDKIKGRVEYLLTEENMQYEFTEEDVKGIKEKINVDLKCIDALLENPSENRPRSIENFLMNENKNVCKKCKFKKLCYEGEEI